MHSAKFLVSVVFMVMLPVVGYTQPNCVAPSLSDQQIKDVIDKGRVTRTDLPVTFPKFRWVVQRQGCYYVYIEYGLPETPDYHHIFRLNQYGVIVDAQTGNE